MTTLTNNTIKWSDEIDFNDISDIAPTGSEPLECEDDNVVIAPNHTWPESVPVTFGAPVMSASFDAPVVQDTAKSLVELEREILRSHNVGESEQLYADGTAFLAEGHARIEREDKEYQALPTLEQACAQFNATIALECRRDFVGDLRRLRLNHDGLLAPMTHVEGFTPLYLEENAWRQIATKAGSQNINMGLANRESPSPMRIRTRNMPVLPEE